MPCVAAATNRGIAAAKETYLRLVDGDDCLVRGSTTQLIQVLEKTGCKFAFGQFVTGLAPIEQTDATIRIIGRSAAPDTGAATVHPGNHVGPDHHDAAGVAPCRRCIKQPRIFRWG